MLQINNYISHIYLNSSTFEHKKRLYKLTSEQHPMKNCEYPGYIDVTPVTSLWMRTGDARTR